jgi:N-acetylglucosamine-6-sulfatase
VRPSNPEMLRALITYRRRWPVLVLVGFASLGLALAIHMQAAQAGRPSHPPPRIAQSTAPNIVFILTDDLSMNLLPFMPHLQEVEQQGMTFNDYFVSDSLCCPSRSSIFTGDFPHDTGVWANAGPEGGFSQFYKRGDEQHTFSLALQQMGYRTALMGKYLNRYMQTQPAGLSDTYVPPGWSEWDAVGWGYNEFNYWMNENGTLHYYGASPSDYLTDVLSRKGTQFIDDSVRAGEPFFLELSTFSPHSPFVPAPQDANSFPGLTAPEPPNFDVLPTNAPRWLAVHPPLDFRQVNQINSTFRRRVQDVQSLDRLIWQIQQTVALDGVANNTYLVFSSDNGLHTGEYRLMPGKLTAFDTDIKVPLIVDGPGVSPGSTTDAMAENIDLAPTFAAIGGAQFSGDGTSLLPVLEGQTPSDWRNAALIEHHGPDLFTGDPDFQQPASGNPSTYEAMRTHDFLYVEYADGEHEFYDLATDPFELQNLAPKLSPTELQTLHTELLALENCHDEPTCWAAMHVGAQSEMMHRLARFHPRYRRVRIRLIARRSGSRRHTTHRS